MTIRLNAHSGTINGFTSYSWDFSGHHRRLADALAQRGISIPEIGDELINGAVEFEITDDQYAALPVRLRRRVDSFAC